MNTTATATSASGRRDVCLVWLEWPEMCFRAEAGEVAYLRSLCSPGVEVVHVRTEDGFLARLSEATRAIVWHFRPEWYRLAPRLKLLATPAAGRELVAWREAPPQTKVHFGGFHGAIISETVAGFMLAKAHGFFDTSLEAAADAPWREAWPRVALSDRCSLVAGSRAVVAGYGRVGRAIGAKLQSLGVEVRGFSRANIAELPDAAKDADWLILALPGDTGTDGFLGKDLLSVLPRFCTVVNIGRGNAVDEEALVEALRRRSIAGAYLDVFRGEPGAGSPDAGAPAGFILSLPRDEWPAGLVATPHSSAFCAEYLPLCFEELKDEGLV